MTELNEKFYVTTAKIAHKEKSHIPFERLEVGQSVFRSLDVVQEASMRSLVSVANRKYAPKFFKIAIHKNEGYIEIARVLNIHAVSHDPGIATSTEGMLKIIANGLPARTIYPFEVLAERQSFVVPIPTLASDAESLQKSLQTACYVQGKKYGKKFHLLRHDEHGMFEVGCIPITEPVIYPISDALLAKANAVQTEVMPSAYDAPIAPEAVRPTSQFFPQNESYVPEFDYED